ncbi:hypothetical protein PIROE2DRAFT_37878, partial [Piromyces sp. E2]
DKDEWLNAVNDELHNIAKLDVYDIVTEVPDNSNIISPRRVLTYKRDSNGSIIKRKAGLVPAVLPQQYGIDFRDTFSPTLKQDSLRIITAILVQFGFSIKQIDINSAYLIAELTEDIYMSAPEGHPSYNKCFWKLKKALYGLKQAGQDGVIN